MSFGSLQLYFGSYANHLYFFGLIDIVPCTSSDWELKLNGPRSTTALIHVNNDWFAIQAIHGKLEKHLKKLLDTFDQWLYGSDKGTAAIQPRP